MTAGWIIALSTGAITAALKAGGALMGVRHSHQLSSGRLAVIVPSLLPAVLSTLIAVQVFSKDGRLTIDARAAGLFAAVVGTRLRLSPILILMSASAVTAAVRLIRR